MREFYATTQRPLRVIADRLHLYESLHTHVPPHEAPRPDDKSEDDGGGDEDGGDGEDDPEEGARGARRRGVAEVTAAALVAHLGQLGVVHLAGGVLQGEGSQHLPLTLALQWAYEDKRPSR